MIYEYFGAVRKLLTACCDSDDISLALLKNSKLCEKIFSSITNIIKQKVVFPLSTMNRYRKFEVLSNIASSPQIYHLLCLADCSIKTACVIRFTSVSLGYLLSTFLTAFSSNNLDRWK